MARRKGRGRRRRGTLGSTVLGILILTLGGAGVWVGAQWAESDGTGVFRTLDRSSLVETEEPAPLPPGVRVRVEVLNAGGVAGMASTAKDELRDLGFDVVYFGNAASFDADDSEVVDRGADPSLARAVADALGIAHVRIDPDTTQLVDVTVRLGAGWQSREERRDNEGRP